MTVARYLLAAAALLGQLALAQPAEARSVFARVDKTTDGAPRALQMAIVSYAPAGASAPVVDLIGAVHIGDRGYYAELNERFRDYDALLYELVAPEGAEVPQPGEGSDSVVSSTQRMMRTALQLEFQLDWIDYSAPNLVHADLSPDAFGASMEARGESLYVYFWRAFYASVRQAASDPLGVRDLTLLSSLLFDSGSPSLKVTIAREMANVDELSNLLDGEGGSALIAARNERAIEVLERRMADGDRQLGIFYGVAHMPDFERRLEALGFQPVQTRWVDAWRLDDEPPPGLE